MKRFLALFALLPLMALLAGCAGYTRGSSVPKDLRAVHLAAFENGTLYPMAGATVTEQIARALIDDGTFSLTDYDSATLRIQGVVSDPVTRAVAFDQSNRLVPDEFRMVLSAKIYAFDARTGEALINGKTFTGETLMLTMNDFQTGVMNYLPRAAKQIADRVLEELHSLGSR